MASQQTAGSKANQGNAAEILPEEVIRHIPLADIFVDYDWNSRSKRNVLANESDAVQDTTIRGEHQTLGTGMKGICLTMRNRGQDTPVILRRVENGKSLGGKKTDKPLELVAGFRRYTAAELLNTTQEHKDFAKALGNRTIIPNTADGTILAVIRVLSAVDARLVNGRENTDRQNLDTQDMLTLVLDLAKHGLNQTQIAEELSMTQGYVSKLSKIGKLPKQIIAHWRGDAKLPGLPATIQTSLRTSDMTDLQDMAEKGGMTEGQTVKRYIEMLNPTPAAGDAPESDKDPVADRVKKAAFMAGALVKAGVLENGNLEWARVIGPKKDGYLIDTGKVDAAGRAKYADMAVEAFENALKDPPAAAPAETASGSEASAN
jgi:ParB-like chromosome segregation protein Spo0J